MSRYAINYFSSGQITEIVADNDDDAIHAALERFPTDDTTIAFQWESLLDYDTPLAPTLYERRLLWNNPTDTIHDGLAIAELTKFSE